MTSTPTSWGLLKQPYKQELGRKASTGSSGLTLRPLVFDEAVADLLKVKPPPKTTQT